MDLAAPLENTKEAIMSMARERHPRAIHYNSRLKRARVKRAH